MTEVHKPVLAGEVSALWQAYFAPQNDERPLERDKFRRHYPPLHLRQNSELLLVDATLGEAGHARQLLMQEPSSRLIGIDADPQMLVRAAKFLEQSLDSLESKSEYQRRCQLMGETFSSYFAGLAAGELQADLILFDLGISLFHYSAEAGRGFSFRPTDPQELLDMRLNTSEGLSASELLHNLKEQELADIFWRYGELRHSRRLARAIVELRGQTKQTAKQKAKQAEELSNAASFAQFVWRNSPKKGKIHPATQVFQALRIAVNDELGQLQQALPAALEQLRPYGLLAVISFHSLEDRIVKQQFRLWQEQGRGQLVYRKVLQAPYNTSLNSERSARLRVLRRMS